MSFFALFSFSFLCVGAPCTCMGDMLVHGVWALCMCHVCMACSRAVHVPHIRAPCLHDVLARRARATYSRAVHVPHINVIVFYWRCFCQLKKAIEDWAAGPPFSISPARGLRIKTEFIGFPGSRARTLPAPGRGNGADVGVVRRWDMALRGARRQLGRPRAASLKFLGPGFAYQNRIHWLSG